MASTRTFTFAEQKLITGSLQLILISHFPTGSGNTNYTPDGRIMSISSFKYKMPEDVTVFRVENITLKFSDLDDYFATNVLNNGSDDATSIEVEIKLDGYTKFLGYIDLKSILRDESNKTTSCVIRGRLAELENKSIDTDLKNEIDGDPSATDTFNSTTYFNLKICIEKIFGLIGYSTTEINWDVKIGFADNTSHYYDFDKVWVKYDDFFGGTPIHDLKNCYQLLKSYCLSLLCLAGIIDDEIYFWDISHTETGQTINFITKHEKKYWDKQIDGVTAQNKLTTTQYSQGDPNGKIVANIDCYLSAPSWGGGDSNMWGDDATHSAEITETTHYLGTTFDPICNQICLVVWAIFGTNRKEIEGEHYGVDLALFQEPTIDSVDYQLSEMEIDYVKNKSKFVGRNLS